ncbi:hypothetical protein AGDE_12362 [Angomonas deanei]|nr:hypothetical protein AGDE_12362 [Angomonas deanei]|eukprot:EPY24408.1 hypothetical protein AGDE_12362 [Angomonas deanei]
MKSTYGGLFQDPPYLSSNPDPKLTDPYDKQECIPSRYLGKNMMAGHPPPGQHPDAYFSKQYDTLASVDQNNGKPTGYEDNAAKDRDLNQKKRVSQHDFRYSSFPQKSTGPGSYYGCLQNRPHEHMSAGAKDTSKATVTAGEVKTALPNIKTNPSKKGTYGMPGTLLSKEEYNNNWKEDAERLERAASRRAKNDEAKPLGPAFHTSGVSKRCLDELPNTGVSAVYSHYEAAPAKERKPKAAAEAKPVSSKPFKASSSKGCINAFPNTWIDPESVPQSKSKKKTGAYQSTFKAKDEWKPNSFNKTSVVSSCLRQFY